MSAEHAKVEVAPMQSRVAELEEMANQTTSRLEALWDEVGYTSEEKRRQMQGFLDAFRTLCQNKVRR